MLLLILLAYLLSLLSQRLEMTIQSLATKGRINNYGCAVLAHGNNLMLDRTGAIHSCNTIISLDLSLDLQPLKSSFRDSIKLSPQFTSTNPPVPSGINSLFARTNSFNPLAPNSQFDKTNAIV